MYAIIENNKVINIILATPEYAAEIGAVNINENISIGDFYIDNVFTKPLIDLSLLKNHFLKKIDLDVDLVYSQAVKNNNYSTPIPASIQTWSSISGLSLKDATDNVIATATLLKIGQVALRTARLTAKASTRNLVTQSDLDNTKSTWATSLSSIRAALGLG
jgi:hypothetical protein